MIRVENDECLLNTVVSCGEMSVKYVIYCKRENKLRQLRNKASKHRLLNNELFYIKKVYNIY